MTIERVITDDDLLEVILDHRGKEVDDIDVLREIEQSVLQSPRIQLALDDSKRIDWLADPGNTIGNVQLPTECVTNNLGSLRDAIDAAKEIKQ